MSTELRGLDAWLERPYLDAAEESDRFYDWADEYGYDLEDDDQCRIAEQAYQEYLEQMYEDWEVSRYEDEMERRADDYEDYWDC